MTHLSSRDEWSEIVAEVTTTLWDEQNKETERPQRWRDCAVDFHSTLVGAQEFGATDRAYSYRNAIIGSTFAARRAGIQQAINPAIASSAAASTYVTGSLELKPKSILFTTCATAIEMDRYILPG